MIRTFLINTFYYTWNSTILVRISWRKIGRCSACLVTPFFNLNRCKACRGCQICFQDLGIYRIVFWVGDFIFCFFVVVFGCIIKKWGAKDQDIMHVCKTSSFPSPTHIIHAQKLARHTHTHTHTHTHIHTCNCLQPRTFNGWCVCVCVCVCVWMCECVFVTAIPRTQNSIPRTHSPLYDPKQPRRP